MTQSIVLNVKRLLKWLSKVNKMLSSYHSQWPRIKVNLLTGCKNISAQQFCITDVKKQTLHLFSKKNLFIFSFKIQKNVKKIVWFLYYLGCKLFYSPRIFVIVYFSSRAELIGNTRGIWNVFRCPIFGTSIPYHPTSYRTIPHRLVLHHPIPYHPIQ